MASGSFFDDAPITDAGEGEDGVVCIQKAWGHILYLDILFDQK